MQEDSHREGSASEHGEPGEPSPGPETVGRAPRELQAESSQQREHRAGAALRGTDTQRGGRRPLVGLESRVTLWPSRIGGLFLQVLWEAVEEFSARERCGAGRFRTLFCFVFPGCCVEHRPEGSQRVSGETRQEAVTVSGDVAGTRVLAGRE